MNNIRTIFKRTKNRFKLRLSGNYNAFAISRYSILYYTILHGVFISFIRPTTSGFLNRYCFHCVYCHLRALIWFGGSLRFSSVRFRFGLVTLGTAGFGICWFSVQVTVLCDLSSLLLHLFVRLFGATKRARELAPSIRFIQVNEMPIETPQAILQNALKAFEQSLNSFPQFTVIFLFFSPDLVAKTIICVSVLISFFFFVCLPRNILLFLLLIGRIWIHTYFVLSHFFIDYQRAVWYLLSITKWLNKTKHL